MKRFTLLFAALAVALLAGCASLTPTAVNPGLTTVTNTAMALVAASSGDCSVPVGMPDVSGSCANLPTTTTVDQNRAAFEACMAAAAGTRLATQAAAVKAAICAQAPGVPAGFRSSVVPPKT